MESIFGSVLLSVIAGLIAIILGNIAIILSRRKLEEENQLKKHTQNLAGALSAQAELARAKALGTLSEKLPDASDQQEFLRAFTDLTKDPVSVRSAMHTRNHAAEDPEDEQRRALVESLVDSYHHQALDQAKIQFWFSVVAATVGFIWIIYTGNAINMEKLGSSLKTFPGIVMETVAFLFFRQAEATRERATALYDRLRNDNQQLHAVELVDTIDDLKMRSAIKAQLALHMAGLSPEPFDLTSFLSGKEDDI